MGNKEQLVGSRSSSKNSEITNDSSTSCFAALGNNNNRKKKGKQKRRTSQKKVKWRKCSLPLLLLLVSSVTEVCVQVCCVHVCVCVTLQPIDN